MDLNGKLIESREFSFLCKKNNINDNKAKFYENKHNLKLYLEKQSPDVFIIGANHLNCRYFYQHLIENLMGNQQKIIFSDLNVPNQVSMTDFYEKNLANYSVFFRKAISLARYKLNPLAETLNLWDDKIENNMLLKLKLCTYQSNLNQEKLKDLLELEIKKVCSELGININKIYLHNHLHSPLNFLLPRSEIDKLLTFLNGNRGLKDRRELKSILPIVDYQNCIGYLRINKSELINKNEYEYLDSTLIHPDIYPIAHEIVEKSNIHSKNGVEAILQNPTLLSSIDFNKLISEYEDKKISNIEMINLILTEFNKPQKKDSNLLIKKLNPKDLFYLFMDYYEQEFSVGTIVQAKVNKKVEECTNVIKCKLENDLDVNGHFNDLVYNEETKENYSEGTTFLARIKEINITSEKAFNILITTLNQDLQIISEKDKKYLEIIEEEDILINLSMKTPFKFKKSLELKNQFLNDNIPEISTFYQDIKQKYTNIYQDIGVIQAFELFIDKAVGEFLFVQSNKSSKNFFHLNLFWKFYNNCFAIIDVFYFIKKLVNPSFFLHGEAYLNLNDIIVFFLKKCNELVSEVTKCKKFIFSDSISTFENHIRNNTNKKEVFVLIKS